jgi:hypothetical protein
MFPTDAVYGESGVYNDVSSVASTQLNLVDTNNKVIFTIEFTPSPVNGNVTSKAYGTNAGGGDMSVNITGASTISERPSMDEWIYVTVNADTAAKRYKYKLTDNAAFSKEGTISMRNSDKETFTGFPRYITALNFRTAKERLAYADDFSVSRFVSLDETRVAGEKERLTINIPDTNNVTDDFVLPVTGEVHGCEISWKSGNEETIIIDAAGNATVIRRETAANVTITATISLGGYSETKTFILRVPAGIAKPLVSTPSYTLVSEGGENAIAEPRAGFVNTAVSVQAAGKSGAEGVYLIVGLVNKSTGRFEMLGSDYTPINTPNETVKLKAGLQYPVSGFEYVYFVTDERGASLKNAPPAPIKNLTAIPKTSSVTLSWDRAADDFSSVTGYIVLRNNTEIARTDTNYYTDSDVSAGAGYSYGVCAVDHGGLVSAKAFVSAGTPQWASIRLLERNEDIIANAKNMTFKYAQYTVGSNGTNQSDFAVKNGVECRKTVDLTALNRGFTYLYFSVDRSIVSQNDNNVTIDVTIYDEGTAFNIEYNAADGSNSKKMTVPLTNTGSWKTVRISLTDAGFRAPANWESMDFRFSASSREIYISEVKVIRAEEL